MRFLDPARGCEPTSAESGRLARPTRFPCRGVPGDRLLRSRRVKLAGIVSLTSAHVAEHADDLTPYSVDLSQAYNGLSSYSFALVSLLTYFSNFSLPILHSLSLHTIPNPLRSLTLRYLTPFHTLALTALALSATWFRYHLFSLTVFAPAVLYRVVWFGLVHLGTNLILARLVMSG